MKIIGNLSARRAGRACLVMLALFSAGGIVFGAAVCAHDTSAAASPWLHQSFSPLACTGNALEIFGRSFLSAGLFIAAAFFMGLSAVGQPVAAAMAVYRGFGIGASVALMYVKYGTEAVPPVLLLILPKAFIALITSMLAEREVIRSSNALLMFALGRECHEDKRRSFKLYCLKFFVLIIISLGASALDAAMNCAFAYLL